MLLLLHFHGLWLLHLGNAHMALDEVPILSQSGFLRFHKGHYISEKEK